MIDRGSEAMVLYLGWGFVPYPQASPERLAERFEPNEVPDLVQYAQRVLGALGDVRPDWAVETLDTAADRAVATVAKQYPELNRAALDALRWAFGFGYK